MNDSTHDSVHGQPTLTSSSASENSGDAVNLESAPSAQDSLKAMPYAHASGHVAPLKALNQQRALAGDVVARSKSKLYEVELGGTLLRLRSSHDQATVDELVNLVNRKLKEALPLTKSGSPQNASILASLHMAEEFLAWKQKALAELDDLRDHAQSLLSELESTRVSHSV